MLSKKTRRLILMAIITICVTVNPLRARSLDFGFGVGTSTVGIGINLNATYQIKTLSYSFRVIRHEEMQIIGTTSPSESATDVSFLIGLRSRKEGNLSSSLELGVGWLNMVTRGDLISRGFFHTSHEKIHVKTFGMAFQTQLYYKHVGLNIFANFSNLAKLSQDKPFGGVALCVRFGG
ncbi:MAG: hypothetical protein V3V99_07495 [candidate division Zixibacteria bacterium]